MTVRVLEITQPQERVYRLSFDAQWYDEQWRNAGLILNPALPMVPAYPGGYGSARNWLACFDGTETPDRINRPLGRVFHSGRSWLELYAPGVPPLLRPGDWVRVE